MSIAKKGNIDLFINLNRNRFKNIKMIDINERGDFNFKRFDYMILKIRCCMLIKNEKQFRRIINIIKHHKASCLRS